MTKKLHGVKYNESVEARRLQVEAMYIEVRKLQKKIEALESALKEKQKSQETLIEARDKQKEKRVACLKRCVAQELEIRELVILSPLLFV